MALNITFYDGIRYHRQDFINRDKDFFGNGLVNLTDFPYTLPGGMQISLGAGTAWVDGYRINNDNTSNIVLSVPAADTTNPRIDIVQIGHDDINGVATVVIKKGVAATSPVEPNADPNYVKVYAISVAANAASISASNITDRRQLVPLNVSGTQISMQGAAGPNQTNNFTVSQQFTAPNSSILATQIVLGQTNNVNAPASQIYLASANAAGVGMDAYGNLLPINPSAVTANSSWNVFGKNGNKDFTVFTDGTHKVQTKNNTLDDGSGNVTLTNVVTVGSLKFANAQGIYTDIYGNFLTPSAVTSGSYWNLQDKTPTSVFKIWVDGTKKIATANNTLDDGNGNMVVAGAINSVRVTANATSTHYSYQVNGTLQWHTEVNSSSSNVFNIVESGVAARMQFFKGGKITTSGGNTLDDGNGNTAVAGGLSVGAAITRTGTTDLYIAPASGKQVGFTNTAQNAWGLKVTDGANPATYTNKNTLDDGSGNMTAVGNVKIGGTVAASATPAYLTLQQWSNASTGSAQIVGGWQAGNWWGIGTPSNTADNTVQIGMTLPSGAWTSGTFKLKVAGQLVTGNNTLDDGSGNMTVGGTITTGQNGGFVANQIGTATSSANFASATLSFKRSTWNGTSAVTGTSYFQLNSSGGLNWFNESNSSLFSINQNASVSTKNNTLDDGNGNATFASVVTGNTEINAQTTLTVGTNQFKKSLGLFTVANGSSNVKADIYFGSGTFHGILEISVVGMWSNGESPGILTKRYSLILSGSTITEQITRYIEVDGKIGNYIALSDVTWDATNSRYRIQIVSLNNGAYNGNSYQVYARVISNAGAGGTGTTSLKGITQGSPYTTDTTTFATPSILLGSNYAIKTYNNTLDDGSGNASIVGTFTAKTINFSNAAAMDFDQYGNLIAPSTLGSGSSWSVNDKNSIATLRVYNDGTKKVTTANNTLDDGSGKSTFNGNMTVNGSIGLPNQAIATSSGDVWSPTITLNSSHWNGSSAVLNAAYLQADNLGGFYFASNGSGSNKTVLQVDNGGNMTVPGTITSSGKNVVTEDYTKRTYIYAQQLSTATSLAAGTFTKVLFDTVTTDNLSEFSSSKFTAKTAGAYQINANIYVSTSSGTQTYLNLYKNGSFYMRLNAGSGSGVSTLLNGSATVQLAVGDYLEIYAMTSTAQATLANSSGGWTYVTITREI